MSLPEIATAFSNYNTTVAHHRAATVDGTDTTLTLNNFNAAKATLTTILRPLAEAERQKNSTLYWDHLVEPFRCIMTKQEQKNHKKALKKRQKALLSGETKTPDSNSTDTPPCTKVLLITSSNRGIELSRSRQAASRLVQALEACTTIKVTHRDVAATQPSNIDALYVKAQFNKKRNNGSYPEEVARMKESDMLCNELKNCDVLIISTGMYNFSVPACLKQWIDHVVRSKTNFYYDGDVLPVGLLGHVKAHIVMSSGGLAPGGCINGELYDHCGTYLQQMVRFIGIQDTGITGFTRDSLKVDEVDYNVVAQHILKFEAGVTKRLRKETTFKPKEKAGVATATASVATDGADRKGDQ